MREWAKEKWLWLVAGFSALVLLIAAYLSGRKSGAVNSQIDVAKRELHKADVAYGEAVKLRTVHRAEQQRLVKDILAEQAKRVAGAQQVKEMSDAEIDSALRKRGDLVD